MEVKPGYKQTEVGVIPEEWEVKSLGSLTTLLTNGFVGTATTAYVESDDGVLYIQGYNVQENGFNFHGIKRVSKAFHARNKKSCLQTGDLLTIQTGDIGVTTVVPHELAGANCHALIISRLRKQESEPGYYCQYFNSERGRVAFKEIETGTTMKHLNGGDMKRLFLPSPPVEEQRAIAKALSDVDGLLGGLDRLIAKKRDLKQAAMQQLLTGQTRLPGFHGEWEVSLFGDVAIPRRDRVDPRKSGAHEFCVELENIASASGELLGSTSTSDQSSLKSIFHPGDVLFGKLRAYLRKYWLANRSGVCSTEIWVLVPKENAVTTEFLFQIVQTNDFIDAASNSYGTHMPRSDWNVVRNCKLRLPSVPEQTAIAEVLTDMDTELVALEQRREKTRALKQAMMQELLTGRTRLVDPAGAAA